MTDFIRILGILTKHEVQFFVTGGISAVLHGAPITTFDLDIVHERGPDNIAKLVKALEEMEAFYRTRNDIKIFPQIQDLAGSGHHLLMTRFGPLDVLGSIGSGKTFTDLIGETKVIPFEDRSIYVQSLQSLIEIKESIGMEKDNVVLPILRKTLEEGRK